jgi:ATP phosphoribosyltransferase regulatory subunit
VLSSAALTTRPSADAPPEAALPKPEALAHPLPAGMRDLLPVEARRQAELAARVNASFESFGYQRVSFPAFEYADVLEKGMGSLDPDDVLRFVEPESGRVVALRPDMTPQVARMLATRLADAPSPARLCYEGSVLRRRRERARRHRQIPQAGIELIGRAAPEGDLEVLSVAAAAVRAAGLSDFVIDLGHTRVCGALLEEVAAPLRAPLVEALALKDAEALARRAERSGLRDRALAALCELPALHGGEEIWARAERAFAGTGAEVAGRELRCLHEAAGARALAPRIVVDLGEPWNFAYYTGAMFQILAPGPGQAVGSGGRYDRLLERFGAPRPAAGFAVDLDNLSWALTSAGVLDAPPSRVLVTGSGEASELVCAALRARGMVCAPAPEGDALAYARAWHYTHVVSLDPSGVTSVATGRREALSSVAPAELAEAIATTIDRS